MSQTNEFGSLTHSIIFWHLSTVDPIISYIIDQLQQAAVLLL